jgi:hypothetical protein
MRTSFCKPDYAQFTSLESIQATARVRLLLRSYVQLAYRLLQLQLLVGSGEKRFPFYAFLGSFFKNYRSSRTPASNAMSGNGKKEVSNTGTNQADNAYFFRKTFFKF